ncbi:MAG: hypothetical protein AAGF99_09670 [Bacteroidota bacterium]
MRFLLLLLAVVLSTLPASAQRVVRADLAFSPDGTLAATSTGTGTLLIWNADDWSLQHRYATDDDRLFGFAFTPDSRYVAFGSNGGRLAVMDLTTGTLVFDVQDRPGSVNVARFGSDGATPDGRLFAAGEGRTLTSYAWRTSTPSQVYDLGRDTMPNGGPLIVEDFDVVPERSWLFVARFDGQARLMDVATGEVVHTWTAKLRPRDGQRNVKDVAVLPGGRTGFFAGVGGDVIAVDLNTGARIDSVRVHPDFVSKLTARPDGALLATLDLDGTTTLLDPAAFGDPDGEAVVRQMTQTASFSSRRLLFAGEFRPGTDQFVTGGIRLPLIVWDIESGDRLRTVERLPEVAAADARE